MASVDGTHPSDFDITTDIYVGTEHVDSYTRPEPIMFEEGLDYTDIGRDQSPSGGNNYRESSSYGTADVTMAELEEIWSAKTGSVTKSGGSGAWTGKRLDRGSRLS